MPTFRTTINDLWDLSKTARIVGMTNSTFYFHVKYQKTIPAPTVRAGSRTYYDKAGLEQVKATVKKLRAEGVIN